MIFVACCYLYDVCTRVVIILQCYLNIDLIQVHAQHQINYKSDVPVFVQTRYSVLMFTWISLYVCVVILM